jgi:outer membrane protein TolC
MRRTSVVGLLLTLLGLASCSRPCFLTEGDYRDAKLGALPPKLECDPSISTTPSGSNTPVPTTVTDTQRNVRYMSLREAIAIALETGTVGVQSADVPGSIIDNLGVFAVRSVGGTDSIRVLALDPAIVGSDIEASLAKFDARWVSSITYTKAETPTGAPNPGFLTLGATPLEAINTETVNLNTELLKPLPTGGVAGITFITDYQHTNVPGGVNPSYQPALQFSFEQPLLQGFGVEINQLRTTHPGSLLTPFAVGGRVEGVLITRIRFDQQRAEFERNVNFLLLNVETAYWNLYNAYFQMYSREEGMRQAYGLWQINKQRYDAGRLNAQDLAQSRLQYEIFRGQRLTALGQVLERERQLRGLLGLPIEDGSRLVPTDSPMLAPYHPDWHEALNDALARRPELTLARQDLKFRQLDLINQRNTLLPDLRFVATDNLHSLGGQIDAGPNPSNALHELVSDPLNTVSLGLRLDMPLGFRDAHAAVRSARLNVARSYLTLRDQEAKAERFLGLTYRQIFEFQDQYQIQRSALDAATIQVERRFQEYTEGRGDPLALLLAQRDWTDALANEYTAITQYANSLVAFEFAKGSIMEHDAVYIQDFTAPHCVEVRAVEHERERTKALVLKERTQCVDVGPGPGLPQLPPGQPVPLPTLLQDPPAMPALTPADRK